MLYSVILEKYYLDDDGNVAYEFSLLDLKNLFDNLESLNHYYMILHDKDDTREHYHILLDLDKKTTTDRLLTRIANILICPKVLVGIKQLSYLSYSKYVRYLTHKDNPEKFQYKDAEVSCDSKTLYDAYCYVYQQLESIQDLVNVIDSCGSLAEVYLSIGLQSATKYRFIIKDLWETRHLRKCETKI